MWYKWIKEAWVAYRDNPQLAGVTLQRQTLVPKKPTRQMEIVDGHKPFLYKLLGSIGFSPHPKRWTEFLAWVKTIDLATFDADVPGLITSDWYKAMDQKSMWTQLFIYFCEEHQLYTLYVNLPGKTTLAGHWREKGEHYNGDNTGIDFNLASSVDLEFPSAPAKYGWDAKKETPLSSRETLQPVGGSSSCLDVLEELSAFAGKGRVSLASSLCGLLKGSSRVLHMGRRWKSAGAEQVCTTVGRDRTRRAGV